MAGRNHELAGDIIDAAVESGEFAAAVSGHTGTGDVTIGDGTGDIAIHGQTIELSRTGGEQGTIQLGRGAGADADVIIVHLASLPTADPSEAGQLYTQTIAQITGSGSDTTRVLIVSEG